MNYRSGHLVFGQTMRKTKCRLCGSESLQIADGCFGNDCLLVLRQEEIFLPGAGDPTRQQLASQGDAVGIIILIARHRRQDLELRSQRSVAKAALNLQHQEVARLEPSKCEVQATKAETGTSANLDAAFHQPVEVAFASNLGNQIARRTLDSF